ncbi:Asp23/Gls24 family envelope stress response protein [Alkalihalobacillus sp. BA299]|uniref:Asp23/Gls24 family envelope stress response protein n=1 Tax=Alkalihalobacillus sp. BA299 TaxID=2815938 RepID=UPI001ADB56EE|nr:Asp23/Gls24 family envelope stress response protein [Alkalihalobacillus sp. BA299]
MAIQSLEGGQLHIKEKVIIDLIYITLQKHSPYIKPYNEWIKRVRSSLYRNEKYGITVIADQSSIELEVSVSVLYGIDIRYITRMLQKIIKSEIEHCTGFTVDRVDIKIEDVHFDD